VILESKKSRFYLFGGHHMQRLSQALQHDIAGCLFGISPLSSVEGNSFWQDALDKELQAAQADYFVLDLQTAMQPLLYACGLYLTATDQNVRSLTTDPIALLEPMHLDQGRLHELFEPFIHVIQPYFDRRHILLVRTYIPEFYWIDKSPRMRDHFQTYAPKQNWLQALEDFFIRKTQCRVIDIERFYFHKKEQGRPLTELIFEDYCYLDMAQCIDRSLADQVRFRPNFRYSLQRYADGKFTLYQRAFSQFLQQEYLLDALILASPKEFVEENIEHLAKLDEIDWSDADRALSELKNCDVPQKISSTMYTFVRIVQGVYDDPAADYALLLRKQIVPTCLLTVLRERMCQSEKLFSGQINPANAGYYFAKMQGLAIEAFLTGQTVIRPILVDIFGSCISRTIFNVCENNFTVNRYWFQIPPLLGINERISYPEDMFPEKPHWADRLVKDQFDGVLESQIKNSPAQWLVIDLFAFITVVQFRYRNCFYTDYNMKISKQLGAEKVFAYRDPNVLGTWDEIFEKMEAWFDAVRKKYGDHIILINGQRKDHWIGDDGVLYRVKEGDDSTPFMEKAAEVAMKKLNCYCIDIFRHFLPEDSAYISNTPAHKENECYLYSHSLVRKIIEQMPKQKHFSSYPDEIRLQRLLRLKKHNSIAKIEQALELSDLDRSVIRLEEEELCRYRKELEELYCSQKEDKALMELLNEAASRPAGEAEFDSSYPDYSTDSGIIGCCCFEKPRLRRVEIRTITNERGMVKLLCASAPGTTVQLLRRTDDTHWQPLKQAPAGYIFDTQAAPLTHYSYMACSVVECNGKHFVGAFSPVKTIHTGVATPVITSAVRVGGINRISWQKVPQAIGYYIYHRQTQEEAWTRCAQVGGDVFAWSEPSENGKFYTLRAYGVDEGDVSGHNHAVEVREL